MTSDTLDAGSMSRQTVGASDSVIGNTALAQCWYQAFDQGDPALLETILAKAWVDIPGAPDQPPGASGAVRTMAGLRAAFRDFRISIKDLLHDGDKVVVRSEMSGTQRGPFLGAPASGRTIAIQAIDIHEIRDGKIIRTWHSEDWMSGLRQLGFFELLPAATTNS